jgi:hypothetical protein
MARMETNGRGQKRCKKESLEICEIAATGGGDQDFNNDICCH